MKQLLDNHECIMAEAAIIERLRRNKEIELDRDLLHAPLIYSEVGSTALETLYREYINIAEASSFPMLICTPTWRANKERVDASSVSQSVNADAAKLLKDFVEDGDYKIPIKVGGLIACKNDCYLPEEALSQEDAKAFHFWQINQLANASVDFLIAVTLPSVKEAAGIALAMEGTGLPYIISFVIGVDGKILDGTSIQDAIEYIDSITMEHPLGYFINCSYPSFLKSSTQPEKLFERLIGIQANASSLSHAELDGSDELKCESVAEWGSLMVQLNKEFGIKVLGGCCGTDGEHLKYLADNIS